MNKPHSFSLETIYIGRQTSKCPKQMLNKHCLFFIKQKIYFLIKCVMFYTPLSFYSAKDYPNGPRKLAKAQANMKSTSKMGDQKIKALINLTTQLY